MNPKMLATIAKSGGLLTRAEAYDCGVFPETLRFLLRTRRLVLVRRGIYADAELWDSLDEPGRHRLRTRAAVSQMSRHYVGSHDSAGYEHGLELLAPPQPLVHITREGVTNAWTKAGVKHHLARFSSDQVIEIDDLEVLDLARTAVDIAREHGAPYGEIACDAVLRRGVSRAALYEALAVMDFWPHVRRARHAVAFADRGAANLVETLGRILVAELGIGEVDPQFPLRLEDGRVAWGDIRVGRHLFEVDGKVKYTPVEEGGVATKSPTEVMWDEKKRERLIRRAGLGVSRIVYADFWPPQRATSLIRMREEYDDTVARFGTRLTEEMVRNAAELRRFPSA